MRKRSKHWVITSANEKKKTILNIVGGYNTSDVATNPGTYTPVWQVLGLPVPQHQKLTRERIHRYGRFLGFLLPH